MCEKNLSTNRQVNPNAPSREPKEYLHFSCCFCGKPLPMGKKIPRGFGVVCLDCSVELRRLKREKEAQTT